MPVDEITSQTQWHLTLATPAEVVDGEARLTPANLAPPASDVRNDSAVNGGEGSVADVLDALALYNLQVYIRDIVSANAFVGNVAVPVGGAGEVVSIVAVADDGVVGGGAGLTFSGRIGNGLLATPIVGGGVTIDAPSDPGDRSTVATPTADNVVAEGDILSFLVGGDNVTPGTAMITATIRRA